MSAAPDRPALAKKLFQTFDVSEGKDGSASQRQSSGASNQAVKADIAGIGVQPDSSKEKSRANRFQGRRPLLDWNPAANRTYNQPRKTDRPLGDAELQGGPLEDLSQSAKRMLEELDPAVIRHLCEERARQEIPLALLEIEQAARDRPARRPLLDFGQAAKIDKAASNLRQAENLQDVPGLFFL